jgi:hypothetical protein
MAVLGHDASVAAGRYEGYPQPDCSLGVPESVVTPKPVPHAGCGQARPISAVTCSLRAVPACSGHDHAD